MRDSTRSCRKFTKARQTGPLCLAAVLLATIFSIGSASAQLKLEFAPEYYYWEEIVDGTKWLDESGVRYALELSYKQPVERGWLFGGRAKLYYGTVDYNGGIQDVVTGVNTPLKSTTEYYGGLIEGRFGYRFGLGANHFLDTMGGLGFEGWLRRSRSEFGYDEYWFPLFLRAGVEVSPSRDTGWIGALGIKVPIYTTETVDFGRLGGPTITLHPRVNVSGYAEAGYQFTPQLSLVAFFDSYWFAESPVETRTFVTETEVVHVGFLQPESKSYQVGLKLGWTF